MAKVSRLVPPRAAQLLGECFKLASDRLPELLRLLLDKVDDGYFELANKADSSQRQQLYFNAMRELRLQRQQMEQQFFSHLRKEFDACFAFVSEGSRGAASDDTPLELALVDADDVEETLAVTNFVESLKARCKQELYGLEARIGHLLSDPKLESIQNPFGPAALGAALRTMCREFKTDFETRLTLFKLADRHAGPGVCEFYRGLNDFLIREGVLPRLNPSANRSNGGARTRVVIETESGTAEATGADVFSTLQQLMQPGTLGTVNPATVGGTPLTTAALLSNLSTLQHGGANVTGATTLDPGLLQTGNVNILRSLREAGAIGELSQTDHLTLDVVTLLFDYFLDDPTIPDRIKALIGRLQIPLLKVALLDKELFSRKTHPARQLLDALAGAAVGWSEGTQQGDALLEKIQYIVFRVVEEFDHDLALFTQLLEELNTFLASDARDAQQRAERATHSLKTQERIVLAKMAVDDAVRTRLDQAETREFVRQFIFDYWRQQLILTYVEVGPASEAWQVQLSAIDDLLWSVQPKTTPDDKRELTNRLPKLLKVLKAGMRELELPPPVCSKFLTMLASVHVVAVKQVEEASLAERKIVQREEMKAATVEPTQDETEFVKQALDRLLARKTIEASELDIDLSALEAEVAAPPPVEEVAPVQDAAMEALMAIDLGDWLEFTLQDGTAVRARFTWISPATGRYLFTDRQGRKAFDLTMNALVDQFREGSVKKVASQPDPLFERAIGELLDRLEHQQVA